VAKKTAEVDRKARIEEMRRAQAAAERRRTILAVSVAGVVVVVLVGIVVAVIRDYRTGQDPATYGVAAAAASCDAPTTDPTSGSAVHVGPGTKRPDITKINYATVPPSSGEHFVVPESPSLPFYTAKDRPRIETLVHNLEHGYTVVWYTAGLPAAQQEDLRKIADLARQDPATSDKFIVSAWDDSYGTFPSGKTVAMSHWGAKTGHRELCGAVSGAAVKSFIQKFPASDAPEPNGA
jgi:hypothetical protein